MSTLKCDSIKSSDGNTDLLTLSNGSVSGVNFGRRNLIINGAMQVAQRGTSGFTSNGFATDRWRISANGFSWTNSQNALTSSDTPYQYGFRSSLKSEVTSPGTASSSYMLIRYRIEGQDIANSGWDYTSSSSYITFSFWVKSSLAGTYYYHARTDSGTAQQFLSSITLSANTWEKVTLTIPGNSNVAMDNDNGTGLDFNWYAHLGTDYSDNSASIESWANYASTSQTRDYTQDWGNTSGATFELTGVQLEVGSVATPFEHRSYGEELALCQRYYFKNPGTIYGGQYGSSTGIAGATCLPTTMRALPSLSYDTVRTTSGLGAYVTNNSAVYIMSATTPYVTGLEADAEL